MTNPDDKPGSCWVCSCFLPGASHTWYFWDDAILLGDDRLMLKVYYMVILPFTDTACMCGYVSSHLIWKGEIPLIVSLMRDLVGQEGSG